MDRASTSADPAALMAHRRARRLEQARLAEARWGRFQEVSRRRYGPRAARLPPLRLTRLLARGKWPGRVVLLAASGVWHGWLREGLGGTPGETMGLLGYVRAGPDAACQPKALFDQSGYIARTPGLAGSAWAPLAHYLVLGDREGRDPHPLFDAAAYRAQVNEHLGRPTALQHFLFRGAAEGLNPHPLFDVRFYVAQSEEVARSGENPLVHYLRKGWREGLDPHPMFANAWYLSRHPAAAAAGIAPLLHYVTAGAREGFDPHPLFDAAWWAGQAGGRTASADPLVEFLRIGGPARKSPTPHFNPGYYVQQLGGAAEVQANPLLHYLTVGSFEGAWPAADFDEGAYFAAYPHAADSGLAALDHWVRHNTARPDASAASSVLSSPDALAANMRAASTPDPFAYDWGAYEVLSHERRRRASAEVGPGPRRPASPLASADGVQVIEVSPGDMRGARQAIAAASGDVVLLAEPSLVAGAGWTTALRQALADGAGAAVPTLIGPAGPVTGARVAADGALQPSTSGARRVEAASGALAIRADRLAEIGGIDGDPLTPEGLFAELSLKLQARGLPIVAAADAVLLRSAAPAPWSPADLARDRQRLFERWTSQIEALNQVSVIALRVTTPQDWQAVSGARPNWRGHLQPKLPADPAPYDPADPGILRRQAQLAERYGLAGFCHQVADLEAAARAWGAEAPAFPFCLAWLGEGAPDAVAAALAPGLTSPLAIRAADRPLLLLAADADAPAWRSAAQQAGAGELYLVQRGRAADVDPRELGFDARLDAPFTASAQVRATGPSFNPRFAGEIYDYGRVVRAAFEAPTSAWPSIPTVRPGYDATPASADTPAIFHDASPGAFQAWLEWALERARADAAPGERLVFVDAWNDWMHGAALEPDRRLGHGWLEAVANALDQELLER